MISVLLNSHKKNCKHIALRIHGLLAASLILIAGLSIANAETERECGGQGVVCTQKGTECEQNGIANLCIKGSDGTGTCQIPCEDDEGNRKPMACSLGEVCVEGPTFSKGPKYYCKATVFTMDLNLLDACVDHFINGLPDPDFSSADECSLERNLNAMLDRDGNGTFNIFDVERCINSFISLYDTTNRCTCNGVDEVEFDEVFNQIETKTDCENNADCRAGLTCNRTNQKCECNDDLDCDASQICDPDLRTCRTYCTVNNHCSNDGTVACNVDTHYCECVNPICPDDAEARIFCSVDADCGIGSFCNPDLNYCQRECGYIVDRASEGSDQILERKCAGNLKLCKMYSGRCETVEVEGTTCEVDSDCPNGAYCFLGECVPYCYTSLQCPDSKWYCNLANKCMPTPGVVSDDVEPFDPLDYSLFISQRNVSLDGINDAYRIPLLIMNKITRKQVFDEPNVVFGYRLEVKYQKKQSAVCAKDPNELSGEELEDCLIDADEEWVTLENPFGTLYGTGDPTLNIRLNYAAVDLLSPGTYVATLRAIFNNGDTDEAEIRFVKTSPNGDYMGTLEVYKNGKENSLGNDNLIMKLYIDEDGPQIEWDADVLGPNYLLGEKEYEDHTSGYKVSGYLNGNSSIMFANPAAKTRDENSMIPLKGIYSPHLGRMRLITAIELTTDEDRCRSEDGACNDADPRQLKVRNVFNRRIRRKIEFIGPFDYKSGRFSGGYRETISGLTPSNRDETLEGEFEVKQIKQDDDKIDLDNITLLSPGPGDTSESVGFKNRTALLADLNAFIKLVCEDPDRGLEGEPRAPKHHFENEAAYAAYLKSVTGIEGVWDEARKNPIFSKLIRFEGEVGRALDELANDTEAYLTLAEYLKGTIEFCDSTELPDRVDDDGYLQDDTYEDGETCVDLIHVQCGLALYQKALLEMKTFPIPKTDCDSAEECPGGQTCSEDDQCECENDVDCTCEETAGCGDICAEDLDCDVGFVCDTQVGTCVCEMVEDEEHDGQLIPSQPGCSCCTGERICDSETKQCADIGTSYVDLGEVYGPSDVNSYTLFCPELPDYGSDCTIPPVDNPALFTLQEHNRFFKELVQTLSYQAGNALSDAFYVMYKAYQGDELDADTAYEHKELKYYDALDHYDALRSAFFNPVPTAVFFQWPMRKFATMGNTMIQYMNTVTNDRLDTLIDLIDLRRRIQQDTDEQDYIFAHHVLQEEYMTRVYLFLLQQSWQKELFRYTGSASEMLQKGRNLLNKVNENRNPLGFHPRRVYFENSDITLNNWQNYKRRVEEEMVPAEEAVQGAITNMQNALRDKDNLESQLQVAAHDFDAQLERLCGSPDGYPAECTIDTAARQKIWRKTNPTGCSEDDGSFCEFYEWQCQSADGRAYNDCTQIASAFDSAIGEYGCRVTDDDPAKWSVRTNNADRMCVRGELGSILQEGVVLETQIEQVYDKVASLLRDVSREGEYLKEIQGYSKDLNDLIESQQKALTNIDTAIRGIQSAMYITVAASDVGKCLAVVGLAAGTNCIGGAATAGVRIAANIANETLKFAQIETQNRLDFEKLKKSIETEEDKEIADARKRLDDMVVQVESYIQEYQLLIQQLYNNQLRAEDTHYVAQRTAARYNDTVGSIVDRLIGRESGSVLLRNRLVKDANERFHYVLEETYKMAQAFLYRYNYGDGAEQVVNKVYTLQTLDDVQKFIEELMRKERDYCGEMGPDCDYKNNQKIFRLSLRDALYPNLKDTYSGGKVLTAGEKFHNEITSDFRAKKRRRASGVRKQIELPIRIWMSKGGGATGENEYMVNPEECNHFITGQQNGGAAAQGTIAVNVIGTRLPPNIEYELWRNGADYIRSCTEKVNDAEAKVETYQVGWAPQHDFANLDNPDTFLTRSQAFTACQNNWRLEDPNTRNNEDACYNFFARDRSLGTQDMLFVLPFVDGDNSWIYGDGLPDDEKPIIEDIILYFRYNSQPLYSDGE